jgi:hypothetical protein
LQRINLNKRDNPIAMNSTNAMLNPNMAIDALHANFGGISPLTLPFELK